MQIGVIERMKRKLQRNKQMILISDTIVSLLSYKTTSSHFAFIMIQEQVIILVDFISHFLLLLVYLFGLTNTDNLGAEASSGLPCRTP